MADVNRRDESFGFGVETLPKRQEHEMSQLRLSRESTSGHFIVSTVNCISSLSSKNISTRVRGSERAGGGGTTRGNKAGLCITCDYDYYYYY